MERSVERDHLIAASGTVAAVGYLDDPICLDAELASVLGVDGPRAPGWSDEKPRTRQIVTTPEPIACGMANLAGVNRPGTPEGVEALCQVVIAIQFAGLLHGEQPVYVVGGTYESGPGIDPETRLVDCVIAAADLGMFAPLRPVDPERDRPWPQAGPSPGGGIWMMQFSDGPGVDAYRRAAHDRECQGQTDPPRSINEQFLVDWDCFIGALADVLTDELHALGLIDKSHPG